MHLNDWKPRHRPNKTVLDGRFCRLEKLSAEKHVNNGLKDAMLCVDKEKRFQYLPQYPPADETELIEEIKRKEASLDPSFYAIVMKNNGLVGGYIAIMRIAEDHGTFEIGNVYMGPAISRTRVSSEAIYLLLEYAFDTLGYRRVEWKCNSLNEPSKVAATRFGFIYEGTFRKHLVVKGQNRDTCWFAMTDDDWMNGVKASFVSWLDEANFTADGGQIHTLQSFRNNKN